MIKTLPSNTRDMGSILGQGTKIPYATRCDQNIKKKIFFNK